MTHQKVTNNVVFSVIKKKKKPHRIYSNLFDIAYLANVFAYEDYRTPSKSATNLFK